ncbi:Phytosulfokine protein [Dioscorea alata]|uniref:Phytosulfokine protein n=1 Tax=Dioscorea alata TaxID=55571 RepID=A0ACB7WNR8_DIOAL|nr:Phytosulfokine protein [Dioscorea alata]
MKKLTIIFVITLILMVSIKHASTRPLSPLTKIHKQEVGDEEGCDGVGDEECLMRRTLSAHVDYIYTQGKGNKH